MNFLRLLCCFSFGIASASAQLPEKSSVLLEKLMEFEKREKDGLELLLAKKRSVAVTLLNGHLKERTRMGELDAALAIKKVIDSLEGSGAMEVSEQLPEESAVLLKKLRDFESKRELEIDERISEKQRAVVGLLSEQMKAETKEGHIKSAVALSEAIKSLEAKLEEGRKGLSAEVEAKTQIPNDAIEHDGVHYKAYVTRTSIEWEDAREECRKHGGRLAWFDSPSDEKLIRTLLEGVNEQVGHVPVWVGALKADPEAQWMWLNGEPVDPGFWAKASDADTHEENLAMARWIGSFKCYRQDHHRVIGYICRWE